MRKLLLTACAIGMLGITPAAAAEWNLMVGEYGDELVGAGNPGSSATAGESNGGGYLGTFGEFSVAVSGGSGFSDGALDGSQPEIWGVGLNLGYGGFTLGGSLADQTDPDAEGGISYDASIAYRTGPWGLSFTYQHGDGVNDKLILPGADEEINLFLLGASYELTNSVTLNAFGGYARFEEPVGDGAAEELDGFTVGTGVKIRF